MNIVPDLKTVLVQVGGFILVLIVFKLYLFKPILGLLDARRNEIEGRYEDADAKRRDAEEFKSDYERRLVGVEDEMRGRIAEAVKEGQAMREDILADSRAQAERILTKAQEEIRREREMAVVQMKTTVADLAVDAAAKLIGEKLDRAKHRKLIGKFIGDLDEVSK